MGSVEDQGDFFAADVGEVPELDLHGADAINTRHLLDLFLHEQWMRSEPALRVLHGKGSGVVRQAVREVLQGHRLVRAFQASSVFGQEDAITLVLLAPREK